MIKLYLKRNFKGLIGIAGVIVFFVVASFGKFNGFNADAASASALMDSLPDAIKIVYGIGNLDISTLGGYYAVVAVYFTLILSVYSASLGAKIIYEEEKGKTSEFLFSKPISRRRVYWTKFFIYVSIVIALNIFTSVVSYVYLLQFDDVVNNYIDMCIVSLLISLLMFSVGAFISAMKVNKSASLIAIGILISLYVLRTVGLMIDLNISLITPFYAFEIENVYYDGISIVYAIYYFAITVGLSVIAPIILDKRDIK